MIVTFDAEHARRKLADAIDDEADRVFVWVWYANPNPDHKQDRIPFRILLTPSEARQLLGLAEQKQIGVAAQ